VDIVIAPVALLLEKFKVETATDGLQAIPKFMSFRSGLMLWSCREADPSAEVDLPEMPGLH
jgi:hypothetical protein